MAATPKVLVVNRGEIAIRILRSARELGWHTVALYTTEPHVDASHATYADEVVKLSSVGDYMSVDAVKEIAVRTNCTHVHPGYGFLSESPALATALAQLNTPIIFIGPSPHVLRLAGDKILSRDTALSLGGQAAPGISVASSDEVRAFAAQDGVGYPVMIKALDGGGGRGIRMVENAAGVEEAFRRCIGESPSGRVFAEKALAGPGWKHIEIQIIGDGTGAVNHLWERECSVQRRFQKIVEVAPSRLPRSAIQPLVHISLKMAKHLKYKGLGTFEYLINIQTYQWVFLEINPRVQVEHTITEEIMGIDLVRAQLLLFYPSTTGSTLSTLALDNPPLVPTSTAIQLRLTAENPYNNFSLASGTIRRSELQWPAGHGVRVDTWLSSSYPEVAEWVVGTDFDSLLAKIIVSGRSFEEATQTARRALSEFRLGKDSGVRTNVHVLAGVFELGDWAQGLIDTLWLERNLKGVLELGKAVEEKREAVIGDLDGIFERGRHETFNSAIPQISGNRNTLLQPGSLFHLDLSTASPTETSADIKKHSFTLTSITHNAFPEKLSGILQSASHPSPLIFSLAQSTSISAGTAESFELADPNDPMHVATPSTGKVVDVHSALKSTSAEDEGERKVKRGETLLVLSVMKMESAVLVPHDGIVERVGKGVKVGAIVGEGMLVCVFRPSGVSKL